MVEGARASFILMNDKGCDTMFSFKLDFPCTNNTIEYKAYFISLITAKEASVQQLKIIVDLGLILGQIQGTFGVYEKHLALYCSLSQSFKQSFASVKYKKVPRLENGLADALATIASRMLITGNLLNIQVI